MIRRFEGVARAVAVTFWFMTATFSWLVSVPFAYRNFIRPRLLPDFVTFAELHAVIVVALLPVAWIALYRVLAHPRSRPVARALLGCWALAALVLPFTPSLASIQPDGWALPVCFASLMFPVGCAIADLLSAGPMAETAETDRTMHDFAAAMGAAAFVVLVYGALGIGSGQYSAAGIGASAITHGLAAAAIFLFLTVVRSLAALRARPVYAEFWLTTCLLAAGFTTVVSAVILPTLSVSGGARFAAGVGFAVALTLVVAARGRLSALPHGDGVLTALAGVIPSGLASASLWMWLAWLPVVAGVAWGFAAASRIVDWNFLIATLGVMIVWLLSVTSALAIATRFAASVATSASRSPRPQGAFAGCVVALGVYVVVVPPPGDAGATTPVDAWTLVDPSFRTLREALRPPTPADADFYPFLQRNTNLGSDVKVNPFDIRHARLGGSPAPVRPHVFLFVIDSLRRDYLSVYNEKVTFTPALAAFAAESTVFERTFTRYGATGLSVPSIWVGGMVPHQQYPEPYAPFNALNHLLQHEKYTTWLSWDNVVEAVVPREGSGPALSTNRAVKDFRFCEMVGDIRSRLGQIEPGGPPVFTWGLAQDVHVSAITREGGGVVDEDPYPGFHPPYASRVKRLDGCFGAFVDDLKARGLYDDSIVIVTADHGDSLGEEGRWGHAYTLFPEILQVPLIVHLPTALADRFEADTSAPAYTADITPSLYALLGHTTAAPSPIFGQTLFWTRGATGPTRAQDGALVASSYGSVYGWLSDDARQLYVSDGVSLRDYRFELDGSPTGRARPVTADDRRAGQLAVREAISDIARFYKLDTAR